jgi:SynChlorMet cassette protein ScmC
MPIESEPPASCISIRLANGQQWRFRPTDTGSEDVIRHLANVMKLSSSSSGKELFVTVREESKEERTLLPGQDPLVCFLSPATNKAMQTIQMATLAKVIARETLPDGGLLIHGALAERDGCGIILAAPGGMGKTTASNRIPPPWHSLSDDATLVVRDSARNYVAHPWPTWIRFFHNGPGGSWDVERGVPLAAIFFLVRSTEDYAEPLNRGESVAFLMESNHQMMGAMARKGCTQEESASICRMELAAVSALVGDVPVYLLHISLTGRFWEAINHVLDEQIAPPCRQSSGQLSLDNNKSMDPEIRSENRYVRRRAYPDHKSRAWHEPDS